LNILTKICVVVLVVLNLFVAAVLITHSRVSENWKQQCENMVGARDAAVVTAQNQLIHAALLQGEVTKLQAQLNADKNNFQEKIAALQDQLTKTEKDKSELAANQVAFSTGLAGLSTNVGAIEGGRAEMLKALTAANAEKGTAQREAIELQAKLGLREAELKRQEGRIDVLQRDVAQLKDLVEKYSEQLSRGNVVDASGTPVAAVDVKGQVTAVRGEMLSINVGSAKGVSEGMLMVVHRKGAFVGYLRISEVEIDQAAGVIEEKQSDPQQGDNVYPKGV